MPTGSSVCIYFVDECEFKVAVFGQRRLEKNRSGMICFRAQLAEIIQEYYNTINWRKLKAVVEQTNTNISA